MNEAVPTYPKEELQDLYKSRYHGAGNLKGVDYQIVVALDCALRVWRGEAKQIVLEGVEDIDVIAEPPVFVQAKGGQLDWTVFTKALTNFMEIHKDVPDAVFEFVAARKLTRDLRNLRDLCNGEEFPARDRSKLIRRVEKSCPNIDAAELIQNKQIVIRNISREELWTSVVTESSKFFHTAVQSVPLYLRFLASQLLEWSKDQAVVSDSMLKNIINEAKTAIAMDSTGYEALTAGYVEELTWQADEVPDDFRDGKAVRPGHIVLNLDVPRLRWQNEIELALKNSPVCVVRASSGQGKSTIVYRHAYSEFPAEETFQLRWSREPEQIEAVRQFLTNKSKLGQKVHLVIDGGDWRTSDWPTVATKCVEFGFPVLAAIRNEDFHRFGSRINFKLAEIVPELTLDEAREIHAYLKTKGRLNPEAPSPEVGFELLKTPKLLMEFIYLLTHGRAIEDRLAEQLNALERNDQPEQITLLRLVTMAHALGAPLPINEILKLPRFRGEPGRLFNSLLDEYVVAESGQTWGLHWVRSDHIGRLLHNKLRNPANTVLELLSLLDEEYIEDAIEEAFMRPEIDHYELADELSSWIRQEPDRLLLTLDAAFTATSRQYAKNAASVFDNAFEYAGMSAVMFLSMAAFVTGSDFLESLGSSIGDGKGFEAILKLKAQLPEPKHFDLVSHIITNCIESGDLAVCLRQASETQIGKILDWLADAQASVPEWVLDAVLDQISIEELTTAEVAILCQGFARYDEDSFTDWIERNPELLKRVALEIDALSFHLEDGEVEFKFLLTPDLNLEDINGEAVRRLKLIRKCIPGLSEYRCEPVSVLHYLSWPGAPKLEDKAIKAIPGERLPLESEVQKNVLVREAAEDLFSSRTIFEFATQWCELHTKTAKLLSEYTNLLKNAWSRNSVLTHDVSLSIRRLRPPPLGSPDTLLDAVDAAEGWINAIEEFISMVTGDKPAPQRAVDSLITARSKLVNLSLVLDIATELTEGFECDFNLVKEKSIYTILLNVIISLVPESSPRQPIPKALRSALRDSGFVVGNELRRLEGTTYLALIREFPTLDAIDVDLPKVVSMLPDSDHVDCYLIVPTCESRAVFPVAFQVSRWANRDVPDYIGTPVEMPEEMKETLPDLGETIPMEILEIQMSYSIAEIAMTGKSWMDASTPASDDVDDYTTALFNRHQQRRKDWCRQANKDLESLLGSLADKLPEQTVDKFSKAIGHVAALQFDLALEQISVEEIN